MGCAGDTIANPRAPQAPYGETGHFGQIVCTSSRQGLECRNADKHGFFLSRARQSVF